MSLRDNWRTKSPSFSKMVDRLQRERALARELHPQLGAAPNPRLVDATFLDKHVPCTSFSKTVGRTEKVVRPASADVYSDVDAVARALKSLDPELHGSLVMRPPSAVRRPGTAMSRSRSRPVSPTSHDGSVSPSRSRPATSHGFDDDGRGAPFDLSTAFQDAVGTRKVVAQYVHSHFPRPRGIVPMTKLISREQRAMVGYNAESGNADPYKKRMAPLLRIKYDALADWKRYAQMGQGAGPASFNKAARQITKAEVSIMAQRAASPGNSEAVGNPLQASLRTKRNLQRGCAAFKNAAPRTDLWDTFGNRQ